MSSFARTHPWVELPADVWHADALATAPLRVVATGEAVLDAQLPGGGWPVGALTEVLQPAGVHSEWRLLLPALVRCGTASVVLVGAPYRPFAPALAAQGLAAERLVWVTCTAATECGWAAEQALRCAEVDAVLAWLPQVRSDTLRRLHMAAAEHHKLLFVMRPEQAQQHASPAPLRLWVAPQDRLLDQLQVRLLKRRGPPLDRPLQLWGQAAALARCLAAAARYGNALDCTAAHA